MIHKKDILYKKCINDNSLINIYMFILMLEINVLIRGKYPNTDTLGISETINLTKKIFIIIKIV